MAHRSFSQSVLDAVTTLAASQNGEATTDDISNGLGIRTHLEHKRILNTLSDLYQAGRVRRIRQGVYGLPLAQRPPDKRQVMWNALRIRRRVTVEDLMVMADVSKDYAREWLGTLVKREVVRKHQQPGQPGIWQLVSSTVDMPEDDTKAAKLRALRRQKKQAVTIVIDDALKNLQTIGEALSKARDAINTMEEGE